MAGLSALFLWHGIHPKQEGTPLKDFFDTWKFKILVAVAVFLVGIMAPMIFPFPKGQESNIAEFAVILKMDNDGDTVVYSDRKSTRLNSSHT